MSLSTATNQHYADREDDWQLTRTFYSLGGVEHYLSQGKYESDGAFKARVRAAAAFPHTRQIIHRISDQLLLRIDEVERDIGPIPSSYMEAAGPEGEAHDLMMKRLGNYLLLYGEAWVQLVPTSGRAVLRILSPLTVPRWLPSKILTIGTRAKPGTIFEAEETQVTYTVHTPRGYTTYVEEENGGKKERRQIDSGRYAPGEEDAFFVDDMGEPTPPLFRVAMPWDTVLGIQLAKTHLQMYRLENQIDGRLHTALTSGQLVYNGLDEDGEDKVIFSHKRGENLIFLPDGADVKPMEVPTSAVTMGEKRLEAKEKMLYETAYNALRNATADSSATETVMRNQSTAAALATLASTIESAETSALRLVAQVYDLTSFGGPLPQDPGVGSDWSSINWAEASVTFEE